jgi:hypothetical protein
MANSLIPGANLPPVSTTLAKLVANFAAAVVDTGGKFAAVVDTGENFATGVFDTGGKFATSINNTSETRDNAGVLDTSGAPSLANISANFRKNSKRS